MILKAHLLPCLSDRKERPRGRAMVTSTIEGPKRLFNAIVCVFVDNRVLEPSVRPVLPDDPSRIASPTIRFTNARGLTLRSILHFSRLHTCVFMDVAISDLWLTPSSCRSVVHSSHSAAELLVVLLQSFLPRTDSVQTLIFCKKHPAELLMWTRNDLLLELSLSTMLSSGTIGRARASGPEFHIQDGKQIAIIVGISPNQ